MPRNGIWAPYYPSIVVSLYCGEKKINFNVVDLSVCFFFTFVFLTPLKSVLTSFFWIDFIPDMLSPEGSPSWNLEIS